MYKITDLQFLPDRFLRDIRQGFFFLLVTFGVLRVSYDRHLGGHFVLILDVIPRINKILIFEPFSIF